MDKNAALDLAFSEIEQKKGLSIKNYLNPKLFEDPSTLVDIKKKIEGNGVIIIRDALDPVLAEVTHREIRSSSAPWDLNEAYFPDGYAYKHGNIWNHNKFTTQMNKTFSIFDNDETKKFMSDLTGRDCGGVCTGSPSYYRPGDHSLPHTDWSGQRTG